MAGFDLTFRATGLEGNMIVGEFEIAGHKFPVKLEKDKPYDINAFGGELHLAYHVSSIENGKPKGKIDGHFEMKVGPGKGRVLIPDIPF
jgi:hypothetical protein